MSSHRKIVAYVRYAICFPGDPAMTLVNEHASHMWQKARGFFILSNLYPSLSAPFALVLSFDPLSVSALTVVAPIYFDLSLSSS
jgi:hypothetical protein